MERLLRCRFWKSDPSRAPVMSSSPGPSTLMTEAPQSESCLTAVGPARTRVRSSTRKRASGERIIRYGYSLSQTVSSWQFRK